MCAICGRLWTSSWHVHRCALSQAPQGNSGWCGLSRCRSRPPSRKRRGFSFSHFSPGTLLSRERCGGDVCSPWLPLFSFRRPIPPAIAETAERCNRFQSTGGCCTIGAGVLRSDVGGRVNACIRGGVFFRLGFWSRPARLVKRSGSTACLLQNGRCAGGLVQHSTHSNRRTKYIHQAPMPDNSRIAL